MLIFILNTYFFSPHFFRNRLRHPSLTPGYSVCAQQPRRRSRSGTGCTPWLPEAKEAENEAHSGSGETPTAVTSFPPKISVRQQNATRPPENGEGGRCGKRRKGEREQNASLAMQAAISKEPQKWRCKGPTLLAATRPTLYQKQTKPPGFPTARHNRQTPAAEGPAAAWQPARSRPSGTHRTAGSSLFLA